MSTINLQCIHANSCIRLKAMHDTQCDNPLEIVCSECAYFIDVCRPANVVEYTAPRRFAFALHDFLKNDTDRANAPFLGCLTIGQVLEDLSERVQLPREVTNT